MGKILLIEDDKFLVRTYRYKLEKLGHQTILLETGEIAIQVAKQEKPDVVLLDLMMPIKDGFTVLRELKSDHTLKNIPVIVLSLLNSEKDIKECQSLGAYKYYPKSQSKFHEVINVVEELLSR